MNKKMKMTALLLVGLMSLSTMVGCSTDKVAQEGESTANGKQESTSDATNSDEPVNLVWWTIGNEPKDYQMVSDAINEYTKEKLNVTVTFKYASWGDYGKKLSNIVQSGEAYDIAFGSSISGYADLANKGYFADLKDLIPTVTPDLNAFIPEELWRGVTTNGQIFGVPAFKDSAQAQYWVWDKELVEKLGIDVSQIHTLQELEPALRKIKENDPTQYPLILAGSEGINGFMPAICNFDTLATGVAVKYDDASATVVVPWEDPDLMENLKIIHKWFNEGLINPDAATLTEAPKYRAVYAAQGFPHAWENATDYPRADNHFFGPAYSTGTIQGSFLAISAASQHVEESLKLIELVNTDSYLRNLLAYGIEGEHYNKVGDNSIEKISDRYDVPAYTQGTFFNMYTVAPAPETMWTDLQKQQEEAFASPALGFVANTQPVQNQIAACSNIIDKYQPSLMTGSMNPEEVIPKMMGELEKAGIRDIVNEIQAQLDAYLGK